MSKSKAYLVLAMLLAGVYAAHAEELVATVVGIADGDTITVLTPDQKQIRVRLAEIDAPEAKQPWGQQAKKALASLVFRKQVKIVVRGTDEYGRTLGRVYVGGQSVNAEMVRTGAAWAYRDYLTDYSLISLEANARKTSKGLWAMPAGQVVAPWDWRHNWRAAITANPKSGEQCGGKRYCRQMSSCAEAQLYLHRCGASSLDNDGDGIACETLCH